MIYYYQNLVTLASLLNKLVSHWVIHLLALFIDQWGKNSSKYGKTGWRGLRGWVEGAPKSREEIYHKPGQHSGVKKRMRESPKRWRWSERGAGRKEWAKAWLCFHWKRLGGKWVAEFICVWWCIWITLCLMDLLGIYFPQTSVGTSTTEN